MMFNDMLNSLEDKRYSLYYSYLNGEIDKITYENELCDIEIEISRIIYEKYNY